MSSKTLGNFSRKGLWIAVLGLFSIVTLLFTSQARAATGINSQINFQGRLLNAQGATVPDGFYNIQFKIYQDGDGQTAGNTTGSPAGSLKWTESYLNSAGKGVTVKNGYMSVQLGSVTAFGASVDWNQDNLWLSMNIGSTNATCTPFGSCTPDGEMIPMKRMSSTPYSLNSGLLGGLASSSFLQLARGVQTDASTNTSSVFINKTGSGNLVTLQSGGGDAFSLDNSGNIAFGSVTNHTISVATATAGLAGKVLTVSAGSAANTGAGAAGGTLTLQGGDAAGTGNNNGGGVTIAGGAGTGTGSRGIVTLGATAYSAATNPSCSADCTILQTNVDNYGTIIVNSTGTDITMTLPAPTNTTAKGRIVYIATASGGQDYTLSANTGTDTVSVAMRQNTTASMIWNGTAWTPGGASNATTLQAVYNNGSNPSTTPEIKLDAIRGTIDIQDADTTTGGDILNVRGSNAGGLGTVLFGVSNTGRVTIQGTSDQYSAFRVLGSNGDYLFNINSNNNYVFSNAIRSPGNEIANPGFETGGSSTGGEEGWFGSALSSIVNTNANTGNYSLQVNANSTNTDIYAGSYYEVKTGESLSLEGYVKNSAGANGNAGVQISWYTKDKTIISYSTSYAGIPGTSYVLRKISAVAPANAYYARVSATVRSNASTGNYYFDDFYMKRNIENADMTFRNSQDGTTAFRIQSAGASQTLFNADTTNNIVKIGDNIGSDVDTTVFVLDSTTSDPTSGLALKNGGLFYRSDSNSLKAVVGGTVVDICTTAVTCSGYSASAGSAVSLQGTTPGAAQTGNFNITGTGILTQLQTQDKASASTASQNLVIRTGNATGTTSNSGNLTLDVGTATGTLGTITIGHSGVATTIGGNVSIQGSNSLSLGTASSATGSILFKTAAGANTITLKAPGANPAASYSLTLPQNVGIAGDCLKDTGSGVLGFSNCTAGSTVSLQNAYDNSSPANITLADGKDFKITAQATTTDPSILFDLQCIVSCSANGGRFAVQNNNVDVFSIAPNSAGITLGVKTQIGSGVTDTKEVLLQLDSYSGSTDDATKPCTSSVNQGALYYNTTMGSIRGCINQAWSDVSNPDTLGLLTFGIVPSTGNQPYDLPSLVNTGYSGPCKVSRVTNNQVHVEPCVAYSNGRRVNVTSGVELYINTAGQSKNITMTTANKWGHICLDASTGEPSWTTATGNPSGIDSASMPAFDASSPILCLADVVGSATTAGVVDDIYDTRTFTSALKEAVNVSSPVELGMIVDAGTSGAMTPATAGSAKLYGTVVATDGTTSAGAPNTIVTTVGPAWVKATAGTAGQFVKTNTPAGYANTTASIPNNSFYYSVGNTRTSYSTTCTTANNCNGSLYVNFIVR